MFAEQVDGAKTGIICKSQFLQGLYMKSKYSLEQVVMLFVISLSSCRREREQKAEDREGEINPENERSLCAIWSNRFQVLNLLPTLRRTTFSTTEQRPIP